MGSRPCPPSWRRLSTRCFRSPGRRTAREQVWEGLWDAEIRRVSEVVGDNAEADADGYAGARALGLQTPGFHVAVKRLWPGSKR